MLDNLPVELTEEILEYLRCSPTELQSCSLLCRALRQRSQKIFFSAVTLVIPQTLGAVIPSCADGMVWRLIEVLELSPHLAEYIRSLTVAHDQWGHRDKELYGEEGVLLSKLLNSLRNLHSFSLVRYQHSLHMYGRVPSPPTLSSEAAMNWADLPSPLKNSIIAMLSTPSINRLHLEEINNLPYRLIKIDHLKKLTLSNVNFDVTEFPLFSSTHSAHGGEEEHARPAELSNGDDLQDLNILTRRRFELPQIVNWMFLSYIPYAVRLLTISTTWVIMAASMEEGVNEVQLQMYRLISTCSDTLEQIQLHTPCIDQPFAGSVPLDFSQHRRLRTIRKRVMLSFRRSDNGSLPSQRNPFPSLVNSLSTIPSESAVQISIFLDFVIQVVNTSLDLSDLFRLDEILAETCSTLQLVVDASELGQRLIVPRIENGFPKLQSQKRISFEVFSPLEDETWNWWGYEDEWGKDWCQL